MRNPCNSSLFREFMCGAAGAENGILSAVTPRARNIKRFGTFEVSYGGFPANRRYDVYASVSRQPRDTSSSIVLTLLDTLLPGNCRIAAGERDGERFSRSLVHESNSVSVLFIELRFSCFYVIAVVTSSD